ncbi:MULTISPECIES: hypothetical protein [Rhizobium]|uniref:Uncharacterized protein n=1 Tax=Rhizobium esperanzae TaxID=1967781 RepID=A0A7W6XSE3_9HYPH|nr:MULTISPECIES: hypothetical protein [Rhizobium]MBB4437183.1 hypothetical protein [Rhizobium esperanzae]MDH6199759.1 hypothetical protein [Rhizobium leguminosarum]
MPIDKRKFMDWNLNTSLGGVTLISMIAGGAVAWNNYQRDIGELQAWARKRGRRDCRRKEVQSTLNVQGGDLRVMKEILQGIEATQKRTTS